MTRSTSLFGSSLGNVKLHGVINASQDSLAEFSIALDVDSAIKRANELIKDGCVGIDLGGAGSTQYAERISTEEEWERLDGKVQAIANLGIELSVDTWNPEIMFRALEAGANFMNAADGLQNPAMVEIAVQTGVPVVLPFLSGDDPKSLQFVSGDPVAHIVDWFEISLIQGYTYQFDCTESGPIDPYLYLRDSQGNIITYDDDGGSDSDDSKISYTASYTGNYFLDVSDYGNNDIGEYTLKAALLNSDDYSSDINTAGILSVGSETSAFLDFVTDSDWFNVSLVQGQTYQFDCTENNSLDTYMYLRDYQGNYIDYNDDGGSDYDDPRITFTADTTGIYFLDIGDIGDNNTGDYEVHFSSITTTDDFSEDINTTGTISIGGKVTADLDFNSDHDWFNISLIQGTEYVFDAISFNSIDPFISLLDDQGNLLISDDNSGNNNNAQITYTRRSILSMGLRIKTVLALANLHQPLS